MQYKLYDLCHNVIIILVPNLEQPIFCSNHISNGLMFYIPGLVYKIVFFFNHSKLQSNSMLNMLVLPDPVFLLIVPLLIYP